MRALLIAVLVVAGVVGGVVALLRYERPRGFLVFDPYKGERYSSETSGGHGYWLDHSALDLDRGVFELRAGGYGPDVIERVELAVVPGDDWTGEFETSRWITIATAPGRAEEGRWTAATGWTAADSTLRAVRVQLVYRDPEETWGGSWTFDDNRNVLERARDGLLRLPLLRSLR